MTKLIEFYRMPKPGAPNASIFIKNLPYDATDDDLRHIFIKYGRLRDVYIPLDYYTKVGCCLKSLLHH